DLAQIVLHQSAEHDRTQTLACRAVDAPNGLLRLVKARHKWQSHRAKFLPLELRHETVAECFRSHTRLVRNEENGSTAHGALGLQGWCDESAVFHPARALASAKRPHRPRGAALKTYVIRFEQLGMRDVETVGGK